MSENHYGFYFDASKCNGCKACHIICKSRFNGEQGVIPRRVYEYVGGQYQANHDGTITSSTFAYYTSVSCNHCNKPACTEVCPTGASRKRSSDGLVVVDQNECIGCGRCSRACPYDAPQLDPIRRVMVKCDGCLDLLQQGQQPLCVSGCPQRALDFGTVAELKRKYPMAEFANVAPLPDKDTTKPNLLIKPNKLSRPSGSAVGKIENLSEV
ncbi:DMSO/selenate family reductase complex B subunit [Ferrimonas senticii]|uniref:DMSO/selenate family reductase complex B subunit n=1 Tax=Ferrimonas senticii TaxID=394566 RepID=UPI00040545B2|nr:DMSO/selenate family reductase complex B subunit [Ferrimonas senticii]